jgi:hypothetical protein
MKLKVTCESATNVPIDDLIEYQGNLAEMSKDNYEKLKKSFIEHGIWFALTVWEKDGKKYIIDGTGRFRTLQKMKADGFEIPALPITKIECKDEAEAKRAILLGRSEFHKTSEEGLMEFLAISNISLSEVEEKNNFSGINFKILKANHGDGKFDKIGNTDLSIIVKILVVDIGDWVKKRNEIITSLTKMKVNFELDE